MAAHYRVQCHTPRVRPQVLVTDKYVFEDWVRSTPDFKHHGRVIKVSRSIG